MFHVYFCYTVLFAHYSLVITCWERADLLAFLCGMFPCVFDTFPYGVSGNVRQAYTKVCLSAQSGLLVFNGKWRKTEFQPSGNGMLIKDSTVVSNQWCILVNFLGGAICLTPGLLSTRSKVI